MAKSSSYTDDKADAICEMVILGKPLQEICRAEGMPSEPTVYRWLEQFPAFRERYVRARELQAETMADMVVDVAMNAPASEDPSRIRAKMEALKWRAGRLKPAKYGEPNLIRRRADSEFEREMINITPDKDDEEVRLLDKKQLARAVWAALYNPDKEKA